MRRVKTSSRSGTTSFAAAGAPVLREDQRRQGGQLFANPKRAGPRDQTAGGIRDRDRLEAAGSPRPVEQPPEGDERICAASFRRSDLPGGKFVPIVHRPDAARSAVARAKISGSGSAASG